MKNNLKIAIVGAGFTGLVAAKNLSQKGHDVDIYESLEKVGGLAGVFTKKNWKWQLEQHYHHLFTNDVHMLNLLKSLNINSIISSVKTSTFYKDRIYKLDSASSLISFAPLSIISRIRTAMGLMLIKICPIWKIFEKFTSKMYISTIMGNQSWKILWEPLFEGKFSEYKSHISASWFWARIYKRTKNLAYPEGGFTAVISALERELLKNGCKIFLSTLVKKVISSENRWIIESNSNHKNLKKYYDKVIFTVPNSVFDTIMGKSKLTGTKMLGAINLVLILKSKFLTDNTYWLNVNDREYPFIALVEHTNMINKENYSGYHILYIGNYLEQSHDYFEYDKEKLLNTYLPFLKRINNSFRKEEIVDLELFKSKYAQPIVDLEYHKHIRKIETEYRGIYLANMEQVYPFDRGTNYAVDMANKVSKICLKK